MLKHTRTLLGLTIGSILAQTATAGSVDWIFRYRLTPAAGDTSTAIATAHFEDVVDGNGQPAIDMRLTNVASNLIPGQGAISYISGLLLAFDYSAANLPGIVVDQFGDDTAQSDRWEPQEDVATVDDFRFTSELGFPRTETGSTQGWRLAPGETAHVQFLNDGTLPLPLTVDRLISAVRGPSAVAGAPTVKSAVKVRSITNLTGGEIIESVPTVVIAGYLPAVNHAPTANAGSDQTVRRGDTVQLDGSTSSDTDGDSIASYQWSQLSGSTVSLSGNNAQRPTFTAPNVDGPLAFSLQVGDGSLQSVADTVTVEVVGTSTPTLPNRAPIADAGSTQSVAEASLVTISATAHDPDGDTMTYQWTQTGGTTVNLQNAETATASFIAPWLASGSTTLSFSLTVTDNQTPPLAATDTVDIQVNNDDGLLDCSQARAYPNYLWPPKGALGNVKIRNVTGPNSSALDLRIDGVTQDEALRNPGLNDSTSPDAQITRASRTASAPLGQDALYLRAERQGIQQSPTSFNGNGRLYRVAFTVSNGAQSCQGTVDISVPPLLGRTVVNDGLIYDSTRN